jgi:hypothetical protein
MSMVELALVPSSVVISVLVYLLVRRSLKQLLDDVVKLPAARKFYLRTLLITLLLGALAGTVTVSISTQKDVPFMERVWKVAASLDSAFWAMMAILLVYVVLQTVLVVALRRHNEQ